MSETKFKLIPRPNKVLVIEDGFKYEGRVIIPEKAMRRPTTGTIAAVGKGVEDCFIGEHILYAQFSGTGIQLKNRPAYRILSPDEILCGLEGEVEIEEVSA